MSVAFSELTMEMPVRITGFEVGSESIMFYMFSGRVYELRYDQDCCASCSVEDIDGDLDMLVGYAILEAEESTSGDNPSGVPVTDYQDSFTWSFYKLRTERGYITIRWYGSSNGYYSETCTLYRRA